MLTLNFHTIAEKVPADGELIIQLAASSQFGTPTFTPVYTNASWDWVEIDETGECTGSSVGYNGESELEGHKLCVFLSEDEARDNDLWMSAHEYVDLLTEHVENSSDTWERKPPIREGIPLDPSKLYAMDEDAKVALIIQLHKENQKLKKGNP